MSNAHFFHAVGQAFKQSKDLPPVAKGKSPLIGFAAGFLGGPVGAGCYLGSVVDFALTLTIVLLGAFFTAGLAAPLFWGLTGCWCYYRIRNSNNASANSNGGTPGSVPLLSAHDSEKSPPGRENVILRARQS